MKKNKFLKKLFKKKMTLEQAILFLIVGLILGTVFTFGLQYWKAPIEREEAISVEAEYSYHKKTSFRRPDSHAVSIHCSDGEIYDIDAHCVTNDIFDFTDSLAKGTKLNMLIHPNSNTILSLDVYGENILDFDEVQEKLDYANTAFLCLGIFMYLLAVCGAVRLIVIAVRKFKK
ncbi:MAG: hypothetical protein J6S71_06385 [Clostridia bacterium]|nr:hypothetical protein [Clostridia bacterium]